MLCVCKAGLCERFGSYEPSLIAESSLVLAHLCLWLKYHALCIREGKALAGLCECLSLYEPSLLLSAISTRISCAGPLVFVA